MTITIAWERRLPTYSELVMCSDSRLCGGGNIDVCQKIFALPREDMSIGFCGSTLIAYPLINQFISYIKHYKKNYDRALDASEVPGRFCELINTFLRSYMNPAELEKELQETCFLIAYFSWKLRRPFIARIFYEKSSKKYRSTQGRFPKSYSPSLNTSAPFAMIGDYRHSFFDIMSRKIDFGSARQLDLEPLEVLCAMLNNSEFTDRMHPNKGAIGGAPQLLKIYPFYRTIEFSVEWVKDGRMKLYLNGREAFDFEKFIVPRLETNTFTFSYPLEDLPGQT